MTRSDCHDFIIGRISSPPAARHSFGIIPARTISQELGWREKSQGVTA